MATSHPNADIANNNICPLVDQEIQMCPLIPSTGDPCLDLFSNSLRSTWEIDTNHCLIYLKQILPLAWSHNPLTTLKLIFSNERKSFSYRKLDTAVFWLLQNHPKTLLRNLRSIADLPGSWNLETLANLVHKLLVYKRGGRDDEDYAAHLHPKRYDRDPDYRLLHDGVMDLLVELLKSDIDKMKQHKLKMKPLTDGVEEFEADEIDDGCLVSGAAELCTRDDDEYRAIFLNESIARRLFPPESDVSEEWERLRKDFLVPLTNYYERQLHFTIRDECVVKKYLKEVEAGGGRNLIKPDALLPDEIIKYVGDKYEDVREAAELQWKAMVEDIKQQQKQGKGLSKLKNCLVVGPYPADHYSSTEVGLVLFMSELNEEPWKGKLIKYSGGKYQLDLIQGHDLKSKMEFIKCEPTTTPAKVRNILEVFDLILEVGVNENLKAEQMIKKVFVFTGLHTPNGGRSEIEHELLRAKFEAIRSKYKDKGYGDDAVPHILFCDDNQPHWICTKHPGFTRLGGFWNLNYHISKSLWENGGEIGMHHVMDAAIADKQYQAFSVFD
ncbi:PREDICTED: uncharacterized protein LOC103334710 [Prunus mume]|uniref:Uncharacterized protein LOC103334710 n=1 Tax=Prunus mume TaxID=102107 RepID=A0ABM0P8L6_PRUMU|nr:PREDICTED: uncharacterized protein LOC103334710 [Prunus mume]